MSLQYTNVIELVIRDNEAIALIQRISGRSNEDRYNICYNPYSCPCYCGPFKTLEEAETTVMKHRPGAIFHPNDES